MKEPEGNPYIREPELDFGALENLSEEKAEEQVKLLREAIEYHDYRYYIENNPVISDKAYDQLFERLRRVEEKFNLQTENSPTSRVGGETLEGFETREHVREMLSLDSSEDEEKVRGFDKKVRREVGETDYHLEPKFDGLSAEFVYEKGELKAVVTRGNGVEGDNITQNVRTIGSVPLKLQNAPDNLVVRGEIYMPKDGFQELNRERVERGEEPFANPRNAAAGTVRQLDTSIVADRPLDVFFYDIIETSAEISNQEEAVELMEKTGLKLNKYNRKVSGIEKFIDYRNSMLEKRDELNYDIDGVVVKVNDFEAREKLGSTSAHPKWAFAYKFLAKTGTTKVKDIAVQVGRTGKLTPVALLEPVDVKGVTISRASLHNEKQVQKLGISRGAEVEVERAGDVIPQIKKVVEKSNNEFRMPDKCPVCGSKVVGEKEHHFCTGGISCPAQLKRKLEYFASKQAMDIEGLGENVAKQLVETGLVEKVTDLYRLEKKDLVQLERFGDKSAEKLLKQIEESKEIDMASFLTGLGIHHVGKETARDLADNFTLEQLRNLSKKELKEIDDIGPEVGENIYSFFHGKGGELVEELLEAGVKPERRETTDELKGVKLVITGRIEGYSREELADKLENHGADVTSSVSSETDYLVIGENPGETKIEQAEQQGVEKLGEDEFKDRILSRIE